jgi:hypothetical protein
VGLAHFQRKKIFFTSRGFVEINTDFTRFCYRLNVSEAARGICVEMTGRFNRNREAWWWNETVYTANNRTKACRRKKILFDPCIHLLYVSLAHFQIQRKKIGAPCRAIFSYSTKVNSQFVSENTQF